MKYLIIRDGENIKHVEPIGHDFTAEDVVVVDEMPEYVHQPGKAAKLVYTEAEGVHYKYEDIPAKDDTEMTETEMKAAAYDILMGVSE